MEFDSFYHVAIKVDDIDESLAFYREHLGATLLGRTAASDDDAMAVSHAALEIADKRVYLFDRAPYEAAGLVDEQPTGFLHFGYVVDDIDEVCRDLAASGVEFIMEPTVFGDLEIAFIVDPSEVRIELLEHLTEQ